MKKCDYCSYVTPANYRSTCPRCERPYPVPLLTPTTQKAKGLVALQKMDGPWQFSTAIVLTIKQLFKVKDTSIKLQGALPAFARPCPPSPEHGFVESRVVKTPEELEALRVETLAACEDSEIMLTPVFEQVVNNSLWTPHLLSVGAGHDGATAGKDTVSFPLVGMNPFTKANLTSAGVDPEKDPYVEAILAETGGYTYLTQLRSGPKLESGVHPDYIPKEMVVEEVIRTNGEDLLEWARVVRGLKGKDGVVVYHPGGSLADHYSVHCRENQVPIVISFEPVVGLVLEPRPMPPLDPEALIKGLAVGDKVKMAEDSNLSAGFIHLCLMALHNSAVLRGPHSFWLGVGVAAIAKLGSAAMDGEARHAHVPWKGFKNKRDIYLHYGRKTLSFHRARLSRLTQILYYGFGDQAEKAGLSGEKPTGCGYGGRKWALCGAALAPLFTSIRRLVESPTEEAASRLLLNLNIAVNQAHNGGWWLNKFTSFQAYNEIPKGNIGFILSAAEAIRQSGIEAKGVDVARFKRQVLQWPEETTIKPLKWRRAELGISPGSLSITLKPSTVPVSREIKIPATSALLKSMISAVGEIRFDRPGEIYLKTQDEEIQLWKETPLVAENRPQ